MAKPLSISYQHFYNADKRPLVTVCYLRNGEHTWMGVAVCSKQDIPCKRVGRAIAFERARHFYESGMEHIVRVRLGNSALETQQQVDMAYPMSFRYSFIRRPDFKIPRGSLCRCRTVTVRHECNIHGEGKEPSDI